MQTAIHKQVSDQRKIEEACSSAGNVLGVVAYFDMFDHPVSIEEIQVLLSDSISKNELVTILCRLQNDKHLFRHGKFYSLRDEPILANKRIRRNSLAQPMLTAAHKAACFFFRFPYVRGIGISGSLSKNVAEEDSDIDLFIITRANRLWIARTFMCLFNKLFYMVRRRHLYCLNYFIDEKALQIQEKNVFTAMEAITLIPVCGNGAIDSFYSANNWVSTYYKGYDKRVKNQKTTSRSNWLKKLTEFFLNNKVGDRLDNYLMKITAKRWAKSEKKGKLNSKGNPFGMVLGKHYSKPNPVFFQEKLLSRYCNKLNELKKTIPEYFDGINLSFE